MLRQAHVDLPPRKGNSVTRPHNPGRNITGVAEPALCSQAGAIFLPEQRQRHVRPAQLAVHHRPVRHGPPLRLDRGRRRIQTFLELLIAEPLG